MTAKKKASERETEMAAKVTVQPHTPHAVQLPDCQLQITNPNKVSKTCKVIFGRRHPALLPYCAFAYAKARGRTCVFSLLTLAPRYHVWRDTMRIYRQIKRVCS